MLKLEQVLEQLVNSFIPNRKGKVLYRLLDVQWDRVIIQRLNDKSFVMLPKGIFKEYLTAHEAGYIDLKGKSTVCREYFNHGGGNSKWDKFTHGQDAIITSLANYVLSCNDQHSENITSSGPPNNLRDLVKGQNALKASKVNKFSPFQLLLQGPPGTGKSYTLKQKLKTTLNLTDTELETTQQIERIVGHPELTSADFIGHYRPITNKDKELEYKFIPGPFTRLLKRALDSEAENAPHILIIEELNRTNAAALFAEVFQLLDRDDEGRSEYSTNLGQDVNGYLEKSEDFKAYLPANFAIWATMNTADQGVFPLDTAFKRRWSFKYLGVDDGRDEWWVAGNQWNPKVPGCELYWQELRVFINQKLGESGFDEDRQLGGFFLSKAELKADRVKESVMTKVIGYLRDDVLRYEPHVLFKSEKDKVRGFGALLREMEKNGILSVFKDLPRADTVRHSIKEYVDAWGTLSSGDELSEDEPSSDESSSDDDSSEESTLTTTEQGELGQPTGDT